MKGVLVAIEKNSQSGIIFGVRPMLTKGVDPTMSHLGSEIFPVPSVDVGVRDIGVGSPVVFHTERDGQAMIDFPEPVRGTGREKR